MSPRSPQMSPRSSQMPSKRSWGGPSSIFNRFRDPILKAVCVHWTKQNVFFMLVSRLFFLKFRSESGCLGLENQVCGKESIAKNDFRRSWVSHDFGALLMILGGIATNFHDFCCPGDWLEI